MNRKIVRFPPRSDYPTQDVLPSVKKRKKEKQPKNESHNFKSSSVLLRTKIYSPEESNISHGG